MTSKKNISLYLPFLSAEQLFDIASIKKYLPQLNATPLNTEWESFLCEQIALKSGAIAWNKIRARQFNIPLDTQTVVCCDPVMMQMTHRGAYLWGQSQLSFTNEEVIQIVAQINEQLMGKDESFFLLDNNRWLYSNKSKKALQQNSFEEEMGKDRFGFSYSGEDGIFWDRLATEIQMLIKQMMDYQGLTPVAPEMIVNVHFWGNSNNQMSQPFERPKKTEFEFYTSDFLFQSFCANSQLSVKNIDVFNLEKLKTDEKAIVIFSKNEMKKLEDIIAELFEKAQFKDIDFQIITQNKRIQLKKKPTFFSKIKSLLNI